MAPKMTSIAIANTTRDALQRLRDASGATSFDAAVQALLWEHDCLTALTALDADPIALADYRAEALAIAETDPEVQG